MLTFRSEAPALSRRRGLDCVATLTAPFAALAVAPHATTAAAASCVAIGLVPGTLWARRLCDRTHPLGRFPAQLAVAAALSLLAFGLPAAVAAKLHTSYATFIALYAVTWIATVASAGIRRGPPLATEPWPALELAD